MNLGPADRNGPYGLCPECPAAIAEVESSGRAAVCLGCGDEFSTVTTPAPARRAVDPMASLPTVLADLAAVARYRAIVGRAVPGGPRAPRCSVGTLQGHSDGAERDASVRQVGHLWELVTAPGTKVGRRARVGFVDALLEHCEETSRPEDPDWTHARACAVRLEGLRTTDPESHRALRALQATVTERASWAECARVVAEALAPAALVTVWGLATGKPGRPRADAGADRAIWGGERLQRAVLAWVGVGR